MRLSPRAKINGHTWIPIWAIRCQIKFLEDVWRVNHVAFGAQKHFSVTQNQVSWTEFYWILLGLQSKTESPAAAFSLWSIDLWFSETPWAGVSYPSQGRVFPGWNSRLWEKNREFRSLPAQCRPANTAALFWLKWIPRVTDGPYWSFNRRAKCIWLLKTTICHHRAPLSL